MSTQDGMERLVPLINKLYRRLLFSRTQSQFDLSYKVFNFDCLFKQYVTEWAIPVKHTRLALLKLKRLIDTKGSPPFLLAPLNLFYFSIFSSPSLRHDRPFPH